MIYMLHSNSSLEEIAGRRHTYMRIVFLQELASPLNPLLAICTRRWAVYSSPAIKLE